MFDNSIVIQLAPESKSKQKKFTFTSFKNRNEVLECINFVWQKHSPHAQIKTEVENIDHSDGDSQQNLSGKKIKAENRSD